MIFSIIVLSISFLLEAFLSSYIPISIGSNSIFIPMFTVISLIIVFPYFNNENSKYLKVCMLFGLLYDVLFTNTLGLNITIFILLGLIIIFLDSILSNSLFSIILKMLAVIFLYDFITYIILLLLNYLNYDISVFFNKFIKSLLLNFIYIIILYIITNVISKKYKVKRLN